MKIKRFQIRNYRCIKDSLPIEVSNLTAITGKNESGKSSILKALYKLNSIKGEKYELEKEWPNSTRKNRLAESEETPVCKVQFELDPEELVDFDLELEDIFLGGALLEVSRYYSGKLKLSFPDSNVPCGYHTNDIAQFLLDLPVVPRELPLVVSRKISDYLRNISVALANSPEIPDIYTDLYNLQESVAFEIDDHEKTFSKYMHILKESMEEGLGNLSNCPKITDDLEEFVREKLPVFKLISDLQLFSGSACFSDLRAKKEDDNLIQQDKIALMILEIAGLDLDKELDLPDTYDPKAGVLRSMKFKEASALFTRRFASHWIQRKYRFDIRPVADSFQVYVSDEHDPFWMPLQERSEGFQRTFSFYLLLLFVMANRNRDKIILLDEPGSHLHPQAQQALLNRLEEYSQHSPIIYSTNLPHMIDLASPEKVYTTVETSNGTEVNNKTQIASKNKTLLNTALAVNCSQAFLQSEKSLILPRIEDCWILSSISNLLIRSGMEGLPEDLFYLPAGGSTEQAYTTSFIVGGGNLAVTVFNSDSDSLKAKHTLEESWAKRFRKKTFRSVDLGVLFGSSMNVTLEDLFSEAFYIDVVKSAYSAEILDLNLTGLNVLTRGVNVKKASRMLKDIGLKFDRRRVTVYLRKTIRQTPSINYLSADTCERIENLIGFVRTSFAEISEEDSKTKNVMTQR